MRIGAKRLAGIATGTMLFAAMVVLAPSVGRAQRGQPREDRALGIAREIAERVADFPSFRAHAAHGAWREQSAWSIRSTEACHEDLRAQGVAFEAIRTRLTPIPAPVRITAPIAGITFRKMRSHAARMPAIAEVLARHGVIEVRVLSAWRREPPTSFHTMGLALDLHSFVRETDTLVVERDYVIRDDGPSCEGELPEGERAAAMRSIACDLAESGVLSTVITPAYSAGHRDHLHVDARPDDTRLFVR